MAPFLWLQTGRIQYKKTVETLPCTSSGVCCGQLPGRVHHDDIELQQAAEPAPVVRHHICMDGYAVRRHLPLAGVQILHIPKSVIIPLHACVRCK